MPLLNCRPLIPLLIAAGMLSHSCLAEAQQEPQVDLSDASLEQLMNIDVTSASKKDQKLSKVPAAIYVLNQEDIRRSGSTSIPELLRLVPGMNVAQVSNDAWAVSARGFNNLWANKLLVLIDGRSVYNPGLSGTLWDAMDVPLDDIERIEVIRGPGATVWGANAVNGVINIITKSSKDTTGGLVDALAGSQVSEQTLAQYGGGLGASGHYRIFGDTTVERANATNILGGAGSDPAAIYHFGFRTDWQLASRDALTVEGDISSSEASHTYNGFYSLRAPYTGQFSDSGSSHTESVQGTWTHTFSTASETSLRVSMDHVDYALYGLHERVTSTDIEFQHHLKVGERNDLVWGVDSRFQPGKISAGYAASFSPPAHTNWLASSFIQDEIRLSNSVWLTAGTKFEVNDYTGANTQPSLRVLWAPSKRNSLWVAVSRALREPSRADVSVVIPQYAGTLPNRLPAFFWTYGNRKIQAESLLAYEAGYRFEPNKRLSLDLSAFYNCYDNLISVAFDGSPFVTFSPAGLYVTMPATFANGLRAQTYGGEVSGTANIIRRWKLSPGYSLFHSHLDSNDAIPGSVYTFQGDAPQQQFQVRSSLSLLRNLDFDSTLYYVSSLIHQQVPAYARLDLRLGWRISDSLEVSAVGQNLLGDHYEISSPSILSVPTNFGRTAYVRAAFHF